MRNEGEDVLVSQLLREDAKLRQEPDPVSRMDGSRRDLLTLVRNEPDPREVVRDDAPIDRFGGMAGPPTDNVALES